MSLLNRLFPGDPDSRGRFNYRVVLDIGEENIRAVVLEYSKEERNILAFSRVKQEYGHMEGGAVANIPGVAARCRKALALTAVQTPYKPEKMITGIAGEFVRGVLVTLEEDRENPAAGITAAELEGLHLRGREQAYQQVLAAIEKDTGGREVLLEEINHSLVELELDGYRVNYPLLFQGRHLKLTLFYTFAPLVQLGALRALARELGLELEGITAEPFALVSSFLRDDLVKSGAVIIDSGCGTTDIVLIRRGGIAGIRMIAAGGGSITRVLAAHYDIPLDTAESLKLSYSRGETAGREDMEGLIGSELKRQYQAAADALYELAGFQLPPKFYFCGGGSQLRGYIRGFRDSLITAGFSPTVEPEFMDLTGEDLSLITDITGQLNGVEHTTTRSLAYYAALAACREKRVFSPEGQWADQRPKGLLLP